MENNSNVDNTNKKRSSKVPIFTVIIVLFLIATTVSLGSNNGNSRSSGSSSSIPTKIENCLHDVLEFLDELVYDIFN